MADKPPILVRKVFGSLRPANAASEVALAVYSDRDVLRIRITKASGNPRRMALYWCCLAVAVDNLGDRVEGGLTDQVLHRKLKRDLGLAPPIVSKRTGEIVDYNYESIRFDSMPEHERAKFIDDALSKLSAWLGCDVTDLRREGESIAA